ncbi:MAG: TauD/TfdA family dioxygenase [Pseudomonadota bacterium]
MNVIERTDLGRLRGNDCFPLLFECADGASLEQSLDWISGQREALVARAAAHGALLFRGFGVASDHDFDAFIQAFGMPNFTYAESLSNAVRVNRTERVFTANEAPPEAVIDMHHEMAQTPVFPSRLFFFCEQAAAGGGETPLCRSDWLLDDLAAELPGFVTRCRELGVRYRNAMPAEDVAQSGQGRSWASTLSVDSREAAEARLAALGYDWEWLDDGSLRAITPVLPAIRKLSDGREVFFNQLIAAYRGWKDAERAITFGDDSPFPRDDMERVCELAAGITFDTPWETGDVVLVDNFLVMHGRRPFTGTRRVLASLVADDGSRLAA